MKYFSFLVFSTALALSVQAKTWRVNNNAGVTADFTSFSAAFNAASVVSGDTIHIESSATVYSAGGTLGKRLVVIGAGYFLNPADASNPANTGLQAVVNGSPLQGFSMGEGSAGSKFIGLILSSITVNASSTPINLVIERCYINSALYFNNYNHNGVTIRKCFFDNASLQGSTGTLQNFVCENNIFYTTFGYINLSNLTGSNNIVRNNSFRELGVGCVISNCYIANNIFGTGAAQTFTNCTIKNNLFGSAQSLPGTATGNQVNVNMTNVYVGGTTGSQDSRTVLKPGSPAISTGLTVGAVVSPDCGAFGATDPYRLSGIPDTPTIYTLSVPVSIPSGSASMNISFSTKNNN